MKNGLKKSVNSILEIYVTKEKTYLMKSFISLIRYLVLQCWLKILNIVELQ